MSNAREERILLNALPEQVAPTEHARFDIDLPALLSPHDMVWKRFMPSAWLEGAPVGNGDFGACVFNQPECLSFALGKTDAWNRRNDERSWYPGESFEDIRQAYLTGDKARYDALLDDLATRRPVDTPHLTTCGTLRLHLDEGHNPANLSMRVGLADGIARLTWDDRRVETFISRQFDVMLVEIDRGVGIIETDPKGDPYDRNYPQPTLAWELAKAPLDQTPPPTVEKRGHIYLLTQQLAHNGHYTIGVRFHGFEAAEHVDFSGRVAGLLSRPKGRHVRMAVTVVSTGDAADTAGECVARLERAEHVGADFIREQHVGWWRDYWMRGLAAVADEAVETWYYRSLYLTGSMLRPGCVSPGLQGVWCGENYPVWSADFHSNINIQAIYWQLPTNNRLELMEPFLRLYRDMADHGRDVAREYFKCRGVKYPHAGSLGGHELSCPYASMLDTDPCETAWLARLYWEYYRWTMDEQFLRDLGYPIIRDAALFVHDRLTQNEAGKWRLDPAVHFEEHGVMDNWGANTLWSQGFCRMGLLQAIAAAEALGVDADLRKQWRDKLDNFADPPTHKGTIWKAFENCEPRYDRHNFLLPMVYPCELVSAWHGPDRWRELSMATWQHLKDNGIRNGTGGPWCGGQGIAEILRLGQAEDAFANARWHENHPTNGFNLSPGDGYGGSFMQADHGPGMARVLADMMVMTCGGVTRLFAGLPTDQPGRFHSLRAPGGFLLSAEKRDTTCDYVLVYATAKATLRLANPWSDATLTRLDVEGETETSGDEAIVLHAEPGWAWALTPDGVDLKSLPTHSFHFKRVAPGKATS